MNNTVLVVDDDAGVLETYRTILTGESLLDELGKDLAGLLNTVGQNESGSVEDQYDLLLVNSGEKAIKLHAETLSQGRQVAVALVDMRMPPGMNGLETAVALRKQDPNIYIVIITAYSDYNIDEIQGALQHDFILLSKPVDPEEFRQITRNATVSYHRFIHLKHPVDFPLDVILAGEQADLGRVLIVDNDPVTQKYCASLLEKQCGYEITLAHSGQEALELVERVEPDLILLDVMMPEMNGYEVCRRLKSNPDTSAIPVIFITARGEEEDIITGFHAGGSDYVTKPFSQEVLLARVTTHLKQYRNHRRGESLSRNRLLKVMRSLNEGMIVTDRRGVITEVNSVVVRMTRYSRDQLIGQQLSSLFVGEEQREKFCTLNRERLQNLQSELQSLYELRSHYFEQVVDDAPLGVMLIDPDDGTVLRANHKMLQLLQHSLVMEEGVNAELILPGIMELRREQGFVVEQPLKLKQSDRRLQMLPVMVSLLGITSLEGRERIVAVVRQQEYEMDATLIRLTAFGQLLIDSEGHREWALHQAGGGTFPVMLQGGVYRDEFHHVEGGVITLMDLRERKRLESQEQYAAFQSGVAEMSANILHNIGNSVQGITTGVAQLKRQQSHVLQLSQSLEQFQQLELAPEERQERQQALLKELPSVLRKIMEEGDNSFSELTAVELVDHGIAHIAEIIQLHRQGFKIDQQAVNTDLYHLLDDALLLTGERLKKRGVRLSKRLQLEQSFYLVPRNQLLQALINVVINATDAVAEQFPNGGAGQVEIQMELVEEDDKSWISIRVSDDGVGVTPEQREKILDFGYSTKERGSGFGLHATANFLRSLEGRILIESEGRGCGTAVTMMFPALS